MRNWFRGLNYEQTRILVSAFVAVVGSSLSTLSTLDDEGVYLLLTKLIAELGPIDVPFGRPAPGRAPPFIEKIEN